MKCLKASSLVSILASVGAFATLAAPAQAEVTGSLYYIAPAANCVYQTGATLKTSGYGNVYNSSTTATSTVICPIVTDVYTDVLGVTAVVMTVSDKSTAGNISCSLNRVSFNGATQVAGTADTSSGSTTVGAELELLPPVTGSGNYVVKCTLPKKGGSSATMTSYAIYVNEP